MAPRNMFSGRKLFMRELTNQDYNTNNLYGNSSVSDANSGFIYKI